VARIPEPRSAQIIRFDVARTSTSDSPRGEGSGAGSYSHYPISDRREGDRSFIPSPRSSRGEGQGEGRHQSTAPATAALPASGELETFEASLRRMKTAVGEAPLYLAASHTYRGDDRARIAALAELGERCGTPIIATNDVLYHDRERRQLQDIVTCIR